MNRTHVQAYYANNKDTVYFRKAVKRCREHGTMPQIQAAVQHKLPLTALLVAFGDWASRCGDPMRVASQQRKLATLRTHLGGQSIQFPTTPGSRVQREIRL